jgi:C4-dicarboxylate-specific signal transduction histidine kinase
VLEQIRGEVKRGEGEAVEQVVRAFEIGSALHSIQVADERITRLVKSLKSYSRQDDGDTSEVDVVQCVHDTLTVLNHRLKHYDVTLDMPDLPRIPGRAGEINQILTNLFANAGDATPTGKGIHIRGAVENGRLLVEVADEGHGIPGALLDRIFEPNVTTKSGGGQYGLGLGLAISRDLAMQHRGTLTAANGETGGAVFRLELPLA